MSFLLLLFLIPTNLESQEGDPNDNDHSCDNGIWVEFCTHGSIGICKPIATGGGFRCYVHSIGEGPDCGGSFYQCI